MPERSQTSRRPPVQAAPLSLLTMGPSGIAVLFDHARRQKPEIDAELRAGEYGTLLGWLREKIHAPGRTWMPGELIERATGEALNPAYHIAHLRERYTGEV